MMNSGPSLAASPFEQLTKADKARVKTSKMMKYFFIFPPFKQKGFLESNIVSETIDFAK
jgi:hypothetical protein